MKNYYFLLIFSSCIIFTVVNGFNLERKEIELEDQVAIVTGGSRGIGALTAYHLVVKSGMKVMVSARGESALKKVCEDINKVKDIKGQCKYFVADVTSTQQVDALFEHTRKVFGAPVRFVFANAGATGAFDTKFTQVKGVIDDIKQTFDINVLGYYRALKNAAAHCRLSQGEDCVLVFCSSIVAYETRTLFAAGWDLTSSLVTYAPTKAAVDHLTRVAASAFIKDSLYIYSLNPAVYDTKMVTDLVDHFEETMGLSDDQFSLASFNPIFPKTIGNPADIGPIIEAFFNGKTAYPPGSNVMCDHHATANSDLQYQVIESSQIAWNPALTQPPNLRDATGHLCVYHADGDDKLSKELGTYECPSE
mmetsp:Transcript_6101/g.9513  ORF Transcript_6101/g.9513 Transcript_6101/m.9513 type:complete len:363 (+) Transcript_6101:41-1129(+)